MHQMLWSEQEKFPQFLCLNTWLSVGGAVFFGGEGLCNLQEAEPSWRNWGGLRGFTAWRDFFPSMYGF